MLAVLHRFRTDLPNILFFCIWLLINIVLFAVDFKKYYTRIEFQYLRILIGGNYLALARASAKCLKFNSALVLVPVSSVRMIRYRCPSSSGVVLGCYN